MWQDLASYVSPLPHKSSLGFMNIEYYLNFKKCEENGRAINSCIYLIV